MMVGTGESYNPVDARSIDPSIDPAAARFFHHGLRGGVGVVLIHGLTASPTEVRPIADYLIQHEPGFTLSCMLLPGHGTTPERLRRTDPAEWTRAVAMEVDRLASVCDSVGLVGVSLGAVLAAQAAIDDPRIRSVAMVSPMFAFDRITALAMPLLRRVKPFLRKSDRSVKNHRAKGLYSYDRYPVESLHHLQVLARSTRARLSELVVPTLIAGGRRDRYMPWRVIESVRRSLGADHVEVVECPASGHVLPHEPDAPLLLERIHSFLCRAHHPDGQLQG